MLQSVYYSDYFSPIGCLRLREEDGFLTDAAFIELDMGTGGFPQVSSPLLTEAALWLDGYFTGKCAARCDLPLRPSGSAFRQSVWALLREIPYGCRTSYGDLATLLVPPPERMSSQAVGGAVGHNPLPIFIPCHRVLGKKGELTGFRCGIARKIWLLEHENIPFLP